MIEFLVMAFFVAQPVPAAAAASADGGVPPAADAGSRPGSSLAPTNLKEPVQISADRIEGERTQATLTGNVKATHRTMNLRCDRMIAYYTQPRVVTRVVCTGGVQAEDGDRMARGERAEYDVASGALVVTGSPEARQGTTYMRGTKVRLTLGSERLEVENAVIIFEPPPSTAPTPPRRKGAGTPARPSPAAPAPATPPAAQGGTAK
ncbi:LptA/OstA family protein [Pyxidicoccus caerfyrddinensis]|uniref:LptA/OstA family protein n=1 Tax=Pyxidicoccus caerfyrddinensis TaxID=2709663 RepID=UPI0013DC6C14|nr:LptA/OstA family protein [Pyxidicoccus caerfyrddinensis]